MNRIDRLTAILVTIQSGKAISTEVWPISMASVSVLCTGMLMPWLKQSIL